MEAFPAANLVYQILASRKRRSAARIRHDRRPSAVPLLAARRPGGRRAVALSSAAP